MGLALLCDKCKADVSSANKVSVSVQALDGSSMQLDFCWACSKPFRQLDLLKKPMREKRMEIRRNQEKMVAASSTPMPELLNDNADVDPDDFDFEEANEIRRG